MLALYNNPRVPHSAGWAANTAVRVFLTAVVALIFSLTGSTLAFAESPLLSASQPTLFKGEMAKDIKIQMKLFRDGSNLTGTYFYELYRRDIELKGTISETGDVFLQEFVNGKNTGSFKGKFVSGERLEGRWFKPGSDKGRAFFLVRTDVASTGSAGPEPVGGSKPQATLRPRAKEPVQALTQPVRELPAPDITSKPTRSAAAPKTENQAEAAAKTAIPVIQEIPLVQQETKAKVPVEPTPRSSGSGTEGGEQQLKAFTKEQAPVSTAPAGQEAHRPAEPGVEQNSAQSQEKPKGVTGRVVGRVIDAVGAHRLPPWMSTILNIRFLVVLGGILLLGAGLAWLAIIAGGMAGFRDNSAFFRKVHAQGLAFLPGVFLLALGVGAVLAVFVE